MDSLLWDPISFEEISERAALAVREGLLSETSPALIGYDLGRLRTRLASLADTFPSGTLHAIAVKANPLFKILREIKESGAGAEVSSAGELALARAASFEPGKIVLDSPVKTRLELADAIKSGVRVNLDSLAELEMADQLVPHGSSPRIGMRINPQLGSSSVSYTSTAGTYSKFGVPLDESGSALLEAYIARPHLNGVHLHIGSQWHTPDLLAAGIRKVLDFANQVNAASPTQIVQFDIGGGLPAQYHRDQETFSIVDYAELLRTICPELFDRSYQLVTEFGRVIHANLGWAVSRIEQVKRTKGHVTALIHLGADMFLRESYFPHHWHHDITVLDPSGRIKSAAKESVTIAGPLCFSGDVSARDVTLAAPERGDYVVIGDVGAYTFSMWSRYNSRPMPRFVGYDEAKEFSVLKEAESAEDVVRFWL